MKAKSRVGKVLKIEWRDSWYEEGPSYPAELKKEQTIFSYGLCIRDDPGEGLTLALDDFQDGRYRFILTIIPEQTRSVEEV